MTVVVLAEEFDLTADRVVRELVGRGVEVFRADTSWFPEELVLDASYDDTWTGTLRTTHRSVRLEDVRSVWYRSPSAFTFPAELSGPERAFAAREAKFGLGGVLMALPALWVNHPGREADASYKPAQLSSARECGLLVPATVVTNDPKVVLELADQANGNIVVKTLGPNVLAEDGTTKIAYTHRLSPADLADLTGVELTAHQFQEWIEKDFDVRATVVGDKVFAAAIDGMSEAGYVDWRADFAGQRLRSLDVPPPVVRAMLRYLARFGLRYGAFDFAVRPDGEWVFLECNPGGQYGWIEAGTGLPITSAMADLLARE